MKKLTLLLLSVFAIAQAQANTTKVDAFKGKKLVFTNSIEATNGAVIFVKDQNGLFAKAKVTKCAKTKCVAQIVGRKKGYQLAKGHSVFMRGAKKVRSTKSTIAKASTNIANKSQKKVTSSSSSSKGHYFGKLGTSGPLMGTFSIEAGKTFREKFSYGLNFSSQLISRSDVVLKNNSLGLKGSYAFNGQKESTFFVSGVLGMGMVTYEATEELNILPFETSETVIYTSALAGYRYKKGNYFFDGGLGFSYITFSEQIETDDTVLNNPYTAFNVALEVTIGMFF
ncbi:hypothetical protein HBN50_08510 [Halobacteriovorax sp. GB3]|uniref:hypothetical protein n=1 Tax=Halobacteriovorax sp. GB3 TaxID=2719615 RepID=UPI002362617E|nr:hypothetical protein [Halobacteriovorax sp. GB3]MDD0853136.1 hypothetical protein [Halobacteriovorax sp. GB3]